MKFSLTIGFLMVFVQLFGQIRVNQPVHELGDIYENGGKVKTTFKLQNPYRSDTIRIVDITTSCGCTAILTKDTLILPLSTIDLDVTYDPAGRLGLFVKSIEISTRTGPDEQNKLFLKIAGNVVAENFTAQTVKTELVDYQVAPIYFYPITAFDTSYLDFNYIEAFVNDLTYEVDYYQFTTVGLAIEVTDLAVVEQIEYLLQFAENKIKREFKRRGFEPNLVFFDEPVFTLATNLPPWAAASVRLYSVNFDLPNAVESNIKVSSTEVIQRGKVLLDYQRFALPTVDEVLAQINFESIEGKLFLNGTIDLRGTILMPYKKTDAQRLETAKELEKAIKKKIKETTGAGKKVVSVLFDSLGIHPADKFQFTLWDLADQEEVETITYEVKKDKITPPQLPTYKQHYQLPIAIDSTSAAFRHFWENLILNHKAGHSIQLLIESSLSTKQIDVKKDQLEYASEYGELVKTWISKKFKNETGEELQIEVISLVHGPRFKLKGSAEKLDLQEFDYFSLIPIVHKRTDLMTQTPQPYMVNFDYFFSGIDVGAFGFQQFANVIARMVLRDGYIELRIESGISKIPIEKDKSNEFVAYRRLLESERRLKALMAAKLIDPNRIIFRDESVVVQGPIYDGTIPILNYRKYHYIRIIPEKYLQK